MLLATHLLHCWMRRMISGPSYMGQMKTGAFSFNSFFSFSLKIKFITRESWCLSQVEELMGQVIGAKYVQDAFGAKEKDDVEKMVEKLMDAFVKLVEESTWMDEATKRNAVLKASSMNVLVGHPDWMRNNTELDQKYEEVFRCVVTH